MTACNLPILLGGFGVSALLWTVFVYYTGYRVGKHYPYEQPK